MLALLLTVHCGRSSRSGGDDPRLDAGVEDASRRPAGDEASRGQSAATSPGGSSGSDTATGGSNASGGSDSGDTSSGQASFGTGSSGGDAGSGGADSTSTGGASSDEGGAAGAAGGAPEPEPEPEPESCDYYQVRLLEVAPGSNWDFTNYYLAHDEFGRLESTSELDYAYPIFTNHYHYFGEDGQLSGITFWIDYDEYFTYNDEGIMVRREYHNDTGYHGYFDYDDDGVWLETFRSSVEDPDYPYELTGTRWTAEYSDAGLLDSVLVSTLLDGVASPSSTDTYSYEFDGNETPTSRWEDVGDDGSIEGLEVYDELGELVAALTLDDGNIDRIRLYHRGRTWYPRQDPMSPSPPNDLYPFYPIEFASGDPRDVAYVSEDESTQLSVIYDFDEATGDGVVSFDLQDWGHIELERIHDGDAVIDTTTTKPAGATTTSSYSYTYRYGCEDLPFPY